MEGPAWLPVCFLKGNTQQKRNRTCRGAQEQSGDHPGRLPWGRCQELVLFKTTKEDLNGFPSPDSIQEAETSTESSRPASQLLSEILSPKEKRQRQCGLTTGAPGRTIPSLCLKIPTQEHRACMTGCRPARGMVQTSAESGALMSIFLTAFLLLVFFTAQLPLV